MYVIYEYGQAIYATTDLVRFTKRIAKISGRRDGLRGISWGLSITGKTP